MKLPKEFKDQLLWCEKLGYGWHSQPPMEYDGDYFKSYIERDNSEMGMALTAARVEFVRRYYDGIVTDIGIGGGRFALEIDGLGYDVSESARRWLEDEGRYWDVYSQKTAAITCWDSLEHIPDPGRLLAMVTDWVFVSMPVYHNMEHCLGSKHYKPGEHLWYWTKPGLVDYMARHGFAFRGGSDIETVLGREDIYSFAFQREGRR